jgi:DNA-binding NarL/FixJ family response regulator
MRVYIADETDDVRLRLASVLDELDGVEIVGHGRDVESALDAINLLRPSVVIVDMMLAGGAVARMVRTLKQECGVGIVIMNTNRHHPMYRERCREAGVDFFFDKSTEFRRLLETFKSLQLGSASSPRGGERIENED